MKYAIPPLGVRAKLNLGLGIVLLVATIVLGLSYAWVEAMTRIRDDRRHLVEIAALARLFLEERPGTEELTTILSKLTGRLRESNGSEYHLVVSSGEGDVLATTERVPPAGSPSTRRRTVYSLWPFSPPSLSETLVIELREPAVTSRPARLTVEESIDALSAGITASLIGHLALAASIAGVAMASVGWLVRRLVIDPLAELATATQRIASGDEWVPFYPTNRSSDEMGMLTDGLAQLSRRLVEAVRRERYGSAHLVAERVRRELEAPIRDVAARLIMLKTVLPIEGEEAQLCREIERSMAAITDTRRRLMEIREVPAPFDTP